MLNLLTHSFIKGLQNDHQALMKEIEKGIHEIHAHAREKKESERQTEEDKTVEGLYQRF